MRNEEYWPEELTAWQQILFGMGFVKALVKFELDEDTWPIYVREFQNHAYVLDGHHRICAAMVYGTHLDVIIAEEFEDCVHGDFSSRAILQEQYISIERTGESLCSQPFERLIFDAYERTLEYMRNDSSYDSDHINEAMRRASMHLEEWVSHNL